MLVKIEPTRWIDGEIFKDVSTNEFVGFDESGLEHNRSYDLERIREGLIHYIHNELLAPKNMEVLSVVKFNSGKAYVIRNLPPQHDYIYTQYKHLDKTLLIGNCGGLYDVLYYQKPISERYRAFGGREFQLRMSDGSITVCNGQWWQGGVEYAERLLGKKLISVTASNPQALKQIFIFGSQLMEQSLYDQLILPAQDMPVLPYSEMQANYNK